MAGHLGGPYHGFSYTHHIYHVWRCLPAEPQR
jgi:hypothetical protein